MTKLLITGSTGFIGTYISEHFKSTFNCMGISRSSGIDVTNFDSLNDMKFKPNIILHIAASLKNDIVDTFTSNVVGTFNICKLAKEKKAQHLVLISSIFIFNHRENQYYNNYAISKKQSEEIAIAYCKDNNINLTILRLSQVYDSNRYAERSQKMLYDFIDTIKLNKSLLIYGNKNPIRNYIHVKDVVSIIDEVITNQIYGTYSIVNPRNHTINEIGYMIFKAYAIDSNISFLKDEKNILSVYVPTENVYDFKTGYISLEDGIKEIIKYEK